MAYTLVSVIPISDSINAARINSRERRLNLKYASHQFYVDDLKLYAKNGNELRKLIDILAFILPTLSLKLNERKSTIKHYRADDEVEEHG
ncbi:unnamed protein product [Enterobius vermicularis]|uniref:Reverse transcriptase domain-containing protein n=1 Tax=Enterobius vermicularis TaxID=51028 RepID=A0A0N4UYM1_ENTVE|nr:unnamed protein product [Enterobius vermicularis]